MTDLAAIRERHYSTTVFSPEHCVHDHQSWPCDVALLLADTPSVEPLDVERLAGIAEMAAGEVMTGNDYARYHAAIRQHFVDRLTRAAEYAPFMVGGVREAHAGGLQAPPAALSRPSVEPRETERDALRTTILAAINNIAHGRTGAAVAGLRAARDQYGFKP